MVHFSSIADGVVVEEEQFQHRGQQRGEDEGCIEQGHVPAGETRSVRVQVGQELERTKVDEKNRKGGGQGTKSAAAENGDVTHQSRVLQSLSACGWLFHLPLKQGARIQDALREPIKERWAQLEKPSYTGWLLITHENGLSFNFKALPYHESTLGGFVLLLHNAGGRILAYTAEQPCSSHPAIA